MDSDDFSVATILVESLVAVLGADLVVIFFVDVLGSDAVLVLIVVVFSLRVMGRFVVLAVVVADCCLDGGGCCSLFCCCEACRTVRLRDHKPPPKDAMHCVRSV